ncbi:Polyketide synthase enoylreductase [Penicillium chermesinum]|nr:Polyketide synthase enoylreductase [Penicillium chermesinum]
MTTPPHPSNMKAWLYNSTTGGLEKNLNLEPSARAPPAPRGSQVLIQVLTASLNPADFKVPEMGMAAHLVIGLPASPGMDFAGRVVTTGPGATHLRPGQLVYGCHSRPTRVSDHRRGCVVPVPEGVELDQAAGLGIAAQSAYQALVGYVKEGDKVFVNGGSGGCGLFAIQIAKALGCHVTVTCSTRNVELCRGLGADEVIDYTAVDDLVGVLCDGGTVYDHVLDHIGSPSELYFQSHQFLKAEGVFVQVGASAFTTFAGRVAWPSLLGGGKRRYKIFFFANTQQHLVALGDMLKTGSLKTHVDTKYEFEDARQAFEKLRSGRARGKILVQVAKA